MRAVTRVAIVAGGYALALGAAAVTVAVNGALTSGPAAQASSGMHAFGDLVLFLAVAGLGSVPPTGAALYFLRPWRPFWIALSAAGVLVAVGTIAALGVHLATRHDGPGSAVGVGEGALLALLAAPVLAVASLLGGLFAPSKIFRIALLAACGVEAAVFAGAALIWLVGSR